MQVRWMLDGSYSIEENIRKNLIQFFTERLIQQDLKMFDALLDRFAPALTLFYVRTLKKGIFTSMWYYGITSSTQDSLMRRNFFWWKYFDITSVFMFIKFFFFIYFELLVQTKATFLWFRAVCSKVVFYCQSNFWAGSSCFQVSVFGW